MFKNVFLMMSQSMSLLGPKLIFLLTPQSVFSPNNALYFCHYFSQPCKNCKNSYLTQPKKSFEKLHLRHQGQEKQLASQMLCEFNDQNNLSFCNMKASLRKRDKVVTLLHHFFFIC